jgi:hypothetical protein
VGNGESSDSNSTLGIKTTGQIAGVAIGGLAIFGILAVALLFALRRWRNGRSQGFDPEKHAGTGRDKRFTTGTIHSFMGGGPHSPTSPNHNRFTAPTTFGAPPQILTELDNRPSSFGVNFEVNSLGQGASGNPYSPSGAQPFSAGTFLEPGFEAVQDGRTYIRSPSPAPSYSSQIIDGRMSRYSGQSGDSVVITPSQDTRDPFRDQNPFLDPNARSNGAPYKS